jgi:hypothetical protein
MQQEDLAGLVVRHAAFPRVIEALVSDHEAAILRDRESPGRWSPLEILVHLRDEEREDFRDRAQAATAGRPITTKIDPAGWVTQRAYNTQDPALVLADFEAERRASCAWLSGLEPEALEATLEHPQLGTMRCGDFVAAWRMHDLLHLRQLATALAVITARGLASWRIDYAGSVPTAP